MEQTKKKIADLVEKYHRLKKENRIKDFNEAQTRNEFIEPLFELLGWDMRNLKNDREVTTEETISGKRVDLAFRLNGIAKFFLEAKSMKADLDVESYARQAIRYSWNKGVDYAVLTDFEEIKVFNANARSNSLRDKIIFQISCENYVSDFEKLAFLSKESFEHGELDKYAESIFKKSQKLSVNEKLFDDFKKAREILTRSFGSWNKKLDQESLDEGVQKILDRLVFIRVLEDRKLEDLILRPLVREEKNNQEIFQSLIGKFRELDDIYNSNLFSEHACEKWENYDLDDLKKVIELLYGNDLYEYDFREIPADILGGVYEGYLGYIAQNPINLGHKSGKLFELDDKNEIKIKTRQKRKEHGIYYTPKFIVDYIVKNTLGEKLKEVESMNELKKIKVLDPACGSGSFLTRALEEINNKYREFGNRGDQDTKTEVIYSNIYGVDLDSQAVELARLNLLLDTLDRKAKLPSIENVRSGNSLISGNEEELKKYFGKNWQDKKPFNWEEEFQEVFSQGGFDVIIGNPPYGAELLKEDKKYLNDIYDIGSTDTAILFIKNFLQKLKDKGRLGFIIPKAFCFASNYRKIRNFAWDNVEAIIDCSKVWKQVKLEQVIIILQKGVKFESYKSGILENSQIKIIGEIKKEVSKKFGLFLNGISERETKIGCKLFNEGIFLNKIARNKRGTILNKFEKDGKYPVIGCKEIGRSGIKSIRGYINNDLSETEAAIKNNSVLVQGIVAHIENPKDHIKITAAIPENASYFLADNINQLTLDKKYSQYYIWAILNSNLINWYCYRFIYGKSIRTMRFDNPVTARIPIAEADIKKQKTVIDLSKKLLDLYKNFQSIPENSDKWNSIKSEIEKTDKEIDEKVYELYGLTEEEICEIKK